MRTRRGSSWRGNESNPLQDQETPGSRAFWEARDRGLRRLVSAIDVATTSWDSASAVLLIFQIEPAVASLQYDLLILFSV